MTALAELRQPGGNSPQTPLQRCPSWRQTPTALQTPYPGRKSGPSPPRKRRPPPRSPLGAPSRPRLRALPAGSDRGAGPAGARGHKRGGGGRGGARLRPMGEENGADGRRRCPMGERDGKRSGGEEGGGPGRGGAEGLSPVATVGIRTPRTSRVGRGLAGRRAPPTATAGRAHRPPHPVTHLGARQLRLQTRLEEPSSNQTSAPSLGAAPSATSGRSRLHPFTHTHTPRHSIHPGHIWTTPLPTRYPPPSVRSLLGHNGRPQL